MKDRYQIKETSIAFSFSPFYHHRKKLKWYIVAMLLFGGMSVYCFDLINVTFLSISLAFLIITTYFFLKEILFCIPIRYTFDRFENKVYQSNLFASQRKIMNLDEVVIFQSSEMGHWQYKIGKKKNQFVKNYEISEYFSDKNNHENRVFYEREILDKIKKMTTKLSSGIPANSGGSAFTH